MKLSDAQQKIVDRMKSGDSLVFDQVWGRYFMKGPYGTGKLLYGPTVEGLLKSGVLEKGISGQCSLAANM